MVPLKIIQLSDLAINVKTPQSLDGLLRLIRDENPALILLCGGVTAQGDLGSFAFARDFLNDLGVPFMALPGPRDLSPLKNFFDPQKFMRDFISPVEESIYEDNTVLIASVNTVRPYPLGLLRSNGAVMQSQIQNAHNALRHTKDDLWRMVVTHHSPIATGKPKGGSIIWGARDFLTAVEDQGVDLILAAHPYQSNIHKNDGQDGKSPMIIECAPANAHYNVLSVYKDHIDIELKHYASDLSVQVMMRSDLRRPLGDEDVIDHDGARP